MKNKLTLAATCVLTLAFIISGLLTQSGVSPIATKATAQEQTKKNSPFPTNTNGGILLINKIPKHLPLKIEIKNADKEDFLGEIALIVTNASDKPIYFLDFRLEVADTEATGGINYGVQLWFGRRELKSYEELAKTDDTAIPAGESVILKVPEYQVKGFAKTITEYGYTKPQKFKLWFSRLSYGDGTGFHTTGAIPYPEKPADESPKNNSLLLNSAH